MTNKRKDTNYKKQIITYLLKVIIYLLMDYWLLYKSLIIISNIEFNVL